MASIFDIHGFLTFTNGAKVINGAEGWSLMSIKVDSASSTNATVTSDATDTIGLTAQNGITIKPGESITIGSGERSINWVTITAPSGCTVYIQAVKIAPIIG